MRGKSLTAVTLVLTILIVTLGTSPVFSVPGVCPVDNFAVSPATTEWTEPAHTIGDTFSVNVTANNLVELYSWTVGISYNTSVLDYTGYEWGDFEDYVALHPIVPHIEGTINTTTGETTKAWNENADAGESANITSLRLITFHFEVVGYGTSNLTLQPGPFCSAANVEVETYYAPTDFALEDGTFSFTSAPVHDIAVTDITGPAMVIPGDIANISVTVENLGDALENFNVTVFYDSEPIGIKPISLGAGLNTTEIFEWNTTNVSPMVYNVTAVASTVEGEINTDNNTEIMEGGIDVIPEFPTLIPLLLALAILAVSTIILKRRTHKHPLTRRLRR